MTDEEKRLSIRKMIFEHVKNRCEHTMKRSDGYYSTYCIDNLISVCNVRTLRDHQIFMEVLADLVNKNIIVEEQWVTYSFFLINIQMLKHFDEIKDEETNPEVRSFKIERTLQV